MEPTDLHNNSTANTNDNCKEIVMLGNALSYGIAMGQALFYRISDTRGKKVESSFSQEEEKQKMASAIEKLRNSIGELLSETAILLTEESLEIFDIYRLMVQDVIFEQELLSHVEQGKTAFEATECVAQDFKDKMHSNSFWRTRFYDMQYLLLQLRKFIKEDAPGQEPQKLNTKPLILVANYISPADLLQYYRFNKVAGLVLKDNGQTSHTAIVARSLLLPVLGNIQANTYIRNASTTLLIDANANKLYINPSQNTLARLQRKTALLRRSDDDLPQQTVTKDNIHIDLYINANLKEELRIVHTPVVKGVGLFRTEILFMTTDGVMDRLAQVKEYKDILDQAAEKQIVFRTIDMTDDKEAAYFEEQFNRKYIPGVPEASLKDALQYSKHLPLATQMGKILFYRHSFLKTQVQALLQARIQSNRPHDPINIMIPMISDTVELKAYQKIIDAEARYLSMKHPSIASQIKLGVMIEVPAIVYQLDKICPLVDFVSIGTNDLFQFFFAVNRWDASVIASQDVLSPIFLEFMGSIISQLQQFAITTHVCGEMATNPLTAMVLLALGIRKLSISPNAVGRIAKMINSLPLHSLHNYMQTFSIRQYELNISTKNQYKNSTEVRNILQNFIKDHHVDI